MPSPELIEARNFADKLRNSLPSSVDAAALGVWSKAPFQILCAREALIWRTEELTRNACDTLDRGDLAVGAILARAIWRTRRSRGSSWSYSTHASNIQRRI